jgi:formylglycine-generating enzyme required for sulfatase activity
MQPLIIKIALLFFVITVLPAHAEYNPNFAMRGVMVVDKRTGERQKVNLYGESHALLIGVSEYNNGWSRLTAIPGELDRVEEFLKKRGFSITRVDNPDSDALEKAFEDFIDLYGYDEQNRLLFFYSGHGHTRKNGSKGYLVPIDAPDPNKNEHMFLRRSLPMIKVLAWAKDIEAKHALFLFDSCFSGSIFKQKSAPKPSENITRLSTKPVRQFITAGSADESVPAQSTFTPAFIDGLKFGLADANQDGYVTGTELGQFLQSEVPRHAAQHPEWGKISDYELSRGDFIFLSGGKVKNEYLTPDAPLPEHIKGSVYYRDAVGGSLLTERVVARLDAEEELWNVVKKSNNPDDVRAYLRTYPDGRFRIVAEVRLRQLDRLTQKKKLVTQAEEDRKEIQLALERLREEEALANKRKEALKRQREREALSGDKKRQELERQQEQERIARKKEQKAAWQRELKAIALEKELELRRKRDAEERARQREEELQRRKEAEVLAKRKKRELARKLKREEAARKKRELAEERQRKREVILSQVRDLQPGDPWVDPTTGMEFVWIEGGCFMMGQSEDEKKELIRERGQKNYAEFYSIEPLLYEVCVKGFYLGKYEVTQEQWLKLMDYNPSRFRDNGRLPVEMISWRQTMEFIEKMSSVYRLPTEAEWEYAARAGTTTPFSFGTTITTDQVNFDGNYPFGKGKKKGKYLNRTVEVGTFPANDWGLYNMHGNVLEWTGDLCDPENDQPPGQAGGGEMFIGKCRVVRGGCWYADAARCRSASRRLNDPRGSGSTLGFRVAFSPDE